MTALRTITLALVLIAATAAQAQTTGAALTPPRDTTRTGQTKPPSRGASPTARSDLNQRTQNDEQQDLVTKGICIGCSPK